MDCALRLLEGNNRGRISLVGRALAYRAGGSGFNFWDRIKTQSLNITEEEGTAFALQTVRPSRDSDDHVKWWSRITDRLRA